MAGRKTTDEATPADEGDQQALVEVVDSAPDNTVAELVEPTGTFNFKLADGTEYNWPTTWKPGQVARDDLGKLQGATVKLKAQLDQTAGDPARQEAAMKRMIDRDPGMMADLFSQAADYFAVVHDNMVSQADADLFYQLYDDGLISGPQVAEAVVKMVVTFNAPAGTDGGKS